MEEYKREESRREEPELIDLTHLVEEFWRALRRMFWLPVVLALVCGIVLPLRAWSNYTPQYRSEVMFTIHSTDSGNESDIGTGSGAYYDKAAAEQLAKTFPYIIGSDLLRDFLKQEMGTEVLDGAVTAQSVENTNLFSLQATSPDAQAAYDTLNTVIRIYPRVADYVIGSTKMELVTQPEVAKEPYNSFRPLRTACKGVILGCGLGLVLVFLYGATRRSIREGKEIRSKLNQTCLGTLPQVPVKRRTKQTTQPVLSIRQEKVSSGFQESVRRLRIKLLRELAERRGQVILVTSTQPGEGKTTVASNLALSLSQNGARVILVDLDLRSPAIKRTLGIHAPSKGIAEIMDQGGSVQEALLSLEDSSLRLLAGDAPTADPRKRSVPGGSGRFWSSCGRMRTMFCWILRPAACWRTAGSWPTWPTRPFM